MDTSNILFICGGTFTGIDEIIRKRLGKRTLGFGGGGGFREESEAAELLGHVRSDDILEFGLIPELVGRLPVVSNLEPLGIDGLVRVMKEPRNALTKQYQALFEMESCELNFTDGALAQIAQRAVDKGVGARGLRGILEEIMLDIMYELPDQPEGTVYNIDESVVAGAGKVIPMPQSKSA
jgi:ATP-dependent Clp protease ATP-binding subunit ClpX